MGCSFGALDRPLVNGYLHWFVHISEFGYLESAVTPNAGNQASEIVQQCPHDGATVLTRCGSTYASDEQIQALAQDWNTGSHEGQGNMPYSFNNNCQHFCNWILKQLDIPLWQVPSVNTVGLTVLRLDTPCALPVQIRAGEVEASGDMNASANGVRVRGSLAGALHGFELGDYFGYEICRGRLGGAAQLEMAGAGQNGVSGRLSADFTAARGHLWIFHGKVGLDLGSEFSLHDERGAAMKFFGTGIGMTNEDGFHFSCPFFQFGLGGSTTTG